MQGLVSDQTDWLKLNGEQTVELSDYTVESLLAELEGEAVLA